jgi:RNA polymerase sigma factor (sigma-70 family)
MKQEDLEILVQQLRQGDQTVRATIIANHMRLAMSIVAKYVGRYPYLTDDMVGATMMGICQAVDWAPTRLYNNNITPYIYQTCERFIRDLIETRFAVNIPRKTYASLREEESAFIPLVQMINAIKPDEDNYLDEFDLLTEQAANTIEDNPMLFEELIESLALSARDRVVIDMLIESYTLEEIGNTLGVTKEMVRILKDKIGDKLKWRLQLKENECIDTTESLHTLSTEIPLSQISTSDSTPGCLVKSSASA